MYGWIRTNGYFYNRNMTDCFLQPNIRFLRAYPIVRYSALPTELHTIFKMVGAVGLAPTKGVNPGDLQSPAIAAMRYSRKMAPEVGLEPTTFRLTAERSTIELLWN